MATEREPAKRTANNLYELLEKRYEDTQGWLLFYEVANATGYKGTNYADALALSIWPSRGIALHGFEVKRSRSDLLKELREESKANAFLKYCNHWWLVVDDAKLIEGVEVPATWGILAPRNNVLTQVRAAPQLTPEEWKPHFIAALMRRFHETYVKTQFTKLKSEIEARAKQLASTQRDQKSNQYTRDLESRVKHLEEDLRRHKAATADFEAKSGLQVGHWNAGKVGETVRWLMQDKTQFALKRHIEAAKHAIETLGSQLEVVSDELTAIDQPPAGQISDD